MLACCQPGPTEYISMKFYLKIEGYTIQEKALKNAAISSRPPDMDVIIHMTLLNFIPCMTNHVLWLEFPWNMAFMGLRF